MIKIYSAPEEVKTPVIDINYNNATFEKECNDYINELIQGYEIEPDGYVGEVIRMPVADGYAQYLVYSMKPLELIHLPIGDALDSPYADFLTKKKVKEMIDGKKALAKLFKR